MTNPTDDIFIPHERAILLVKCDFSYSCAAADKISTDLRARAVSLRQLSYLFPSDSGPSGEVASLAAVFSHGVWTVFGANDARVVVSNLCRKHIEQ